MSVRVLQRREEIDAAASRLRARGLQSRRGDGDLAWCIASAIRTRRLPRRPHSLKSWDVELTLRAIEERVDRDGRIVDLGAYNSAVLPALARLGYRQLDGIDLDPALASGPRRDRIRYHVADFHAMPFLADASCAAITAISTIEHGWRGIDLFREVSRVLRPGGIFAASTDYWPEKVDTSGSEMFGLSWTIFSAAEIEALLADAASVGLLPVGDVRLEASERVIAWNDRRYTFAYLLLQRAS